MRPHCFSRFHLPVSSEVPWGSFLALLRLQASPPEPKSGSYCTIAFNQAVSCWLCTIAETVGLSPAATPGAPFIPVGKDAMTPLSSFHLQKSRLYALIFWFYPLPCKGHLSIFDLCWGDFTTPPSYYIGRLFQIFNHPPGSVEGKTPFLHPI